ncbi:hypothetical protein RE628_25385 [Paenibacillus sp. D2_2]|uniref:hypothetical protein n=1 Tax=Paenibacillus sp. D2_2 TaxID=3073092 RepID=UPI0028168268|nr:hypothetical protein [Paenibacillus sp. D2_2]WMT40485.1 hypothetical protein RE628_25385 [Paenibacillus sp. D2_2]
MKKKKIKNIEELRKEQDKSNDPIFYNSADLSVDTYKLLLEFIDLVSEDTYYIERGQYDEIRVLKYIKMKLEHYSPNKFIVSPILRHFRNDAMPSIKLFVRYTKNESKFVTHLLCDRDNVYSFNHAYNFGSFYDTDGNINFSFLDEIVDNINEISMKSNRYSR